MKFPDRPVLECAANVIAENLLSRVDEEGFSKATIKYSVNFEKDCTATNMKDKWLCSRNGRINFRNSLMG